MGGVDRTALMTPDDNLSLTKLVNGTTGPYGAYVNYMRR